MVRRLPILAAGLACGLLAACSLNVGRPALAAAGAPAGPRVIERPATAPGNALAVIYSGDNGWAQRVRRIAKGLAGAGVPVIGISSPYYFARAPSQDRAARDLAALIDRYGAAWDRRQVVLVGYSYGADTLPLIVAALPPEARGRVRLVVLMSPADRADLDFRGASWFNLTTPWARPVAPALAGLGDIPVICLHAEHDPRAACDRLAAPGMQSVKLPGGHSYAGQEAPVVRAILDRIKPGASAPCAGC